MSKKLVPIEPTSEERAYHLGWMACFDKNSVGNPYNSETEVNLYENWEDGNKSAQIVMESMANA